MTVYDLHYEAHGQPVVERFDSATGRALRMIELPCGTVFQVSETRADVEARNEAILRGDLKEAL